MGSDIINELSKDIVICYFVEKELKPMGFEHLTFIKVNPAKLDIFDTEKGDPELVFGDKDWEPIRNRIFNRIKEFLAKPDEAAAFIKEHEVEFQSISVRYQARPKMFKPGPMGHHLG